MKLFKAEWIDKERSQQVKMLPLNFSIKSYRHYLFECGLYILLGGLG